MSYHLGLLLGFQLLVQLAQAGRSGVVRITTSHQQRRPRKRAHRARYAAPVLGIGDHLAGSREGRIVELEVHEDLRSSSAAARRGDLAGEGARGACARETPVSEGGRHSGRQTDRALVGRHTA